jgi:hypothetical protein
MKLLAGGGSQQSRWLPGEPGLPSKGNIGGSGRARCYRALRGRAVARSSEKFGNKTLDKIAYAWQA